MIYNKVTIHYNFPPKLIFFKIIFHCFIIHKTKFKHSLTKPNENRFFFKVVDTFPLSKLRDLTIPSLTKPNDNEYY